MFRHYHYLSGALPSNARCYCAVYGDTPVAFMAVVHVRMRVRYYRVSRLVVLPDYQGIGVGKRLLNFIADLYAVQTRLPFFIVTSNPQLIRGGLAGWRVIRAGHAGCAREDTLLNNELRGSLSRRRLTVTLQYVGNISF